MALMQVGMQMRKSLDEWSTFVAAMVMTIHLGDRLQMRFTDDDVVRVKTLRDLTNLIAERMEQTGDLASRSVELTNWAVAELVRDTR